MLLNRLRKDVEGATMVEFAVVLFVLVLLVGGLIDFMNIFWQRNMLIKAVERGARVAAVSDPVVAGLATVNMLPAGCTGPGAPWPQGGGNYGPFSCTATIGPGPGYAITGTCNAAVNKIVSGRAGGACGLAGHNTYTLGMCDLFNLAGANVTITYSDTGLGFCGRTNPAGNPAPVPTITVTVQNAQFRHFFLAGLYPALNLTTAQATITGEDLSFLSFAAPP
jgi:TadE-like protein